MNALLVGADTLGNIPEVLNSYGIDEYTHISGRKKGMRNSIIPSKVDLVIVFTDFVEHPVLKNIKTQAKESNIPCIYTKRSTTHLSEKLKGCISCSHFQNGNCILMDKHASLA